MKKTFIVLTIVTVAYVSMVVLGQSSPSPIADSLAKSQQSTFEVSVVANNAEEDTVGVIEADEALSIMERKEAISEQDMIVPNVYMEGCPDNSKDIPGSLSIRCNSYTTDGVNVYFHGIPMDVDKATFKVFPAGTQYFSGMHPDLIFAKDKDTVYLQDQALVGISPEEFNLLDRYLPSYDEEAADRTLNKIFEFNPEVPNLKILFNYKSRFYDFEDIENAVGDYYRSLEEKPGPVLAIVNYKEITYSELETSVNAIYFPAVAHRLNMNEGREEALDALITRTLLLQAAEKEGVLATWGEVMVELDDKIEGLGGYEFVQRRRDGLGVSEGRLFIKIRNDISIQRLYEVMGFKEESGREITDAEINNYYLQIGGKETNLPLTEDRKEEIAWQINLNAKQAAINAYIQKLKLTSSIVKI